MFWLSSYTPPIAKLPIYNLLFVSLVAFWKLTVLTRAVYAMTGHTDF